MTQLYTFWVSHFSEKVRWCLDFEGVSYREHRLLPGIHTLTLRKMGAGQKVPVLEHQGTLIQGSGAILDALVGLFGVNRLQPWEALDRDRDPEKLHQARRLRARASELETLADEALGRGIQAFGYDVLLRSPRYLFDLWAYGGPFWAKLFYRAVFPKLSSYVRAEYCPSPEAIEDGKQRFFRAMDTFDAILADQPYLLGEQLTRTDVTVAALLAPVVRPKEHVMARPEYPPELTELVERQAVRPTGQFALRMYGQHRRASIASSSGSENRGSENRGSENRGSRG